MRAYSSGWNWQASRSRALATRPRGAILVGLTLIALSADLAASATPQRAWVRRVHLDSVDSLNALAASSAGTIYATGNVGDNSGFNADCLTRAYLPDGSTLWSDQYDGGHSGEDNCDALALAPSGDLYVAGYSTDDDPSFRRYLILKYDANGSLAWDLTFTGQDLGGWGNAFANDVVVDHLGFVYVTGQAASPYLSGLGYDYLTMKLAPTGVVEWTARYPGEPHSWGDVARRVVVDFSGKSYVTGSSPNSDGDNDYLTVKYDRWGDTLWEKRLDGPGASDDDDAFALAVDPTGGVRVTGDSPSLAGDSDYLTIRYLDDGQVDWSTRYDGPEDSGDGAYEILIADDGSTYVTGASWGGELPGGTQFDVATVKYGPDGAQLWARRFHNNTKPTNSERGVAIAEDRQGNVYVLGGPAVAGSDIFALNYQPDGALHWVVRYDGDSNTDYANALALDRMCNIYTAGSSYEGTATGFDWVLIKYVLQGADAVDSDGDSVPDRCDSCGGFDDLLDSDADGVPDGCDPCPSNGNIYCLFADGFESGDTSAW